MLKSSSRIPAPKVKPIVIGNTRIEQVKNGFTAGLEKMSGYIASLLTILTIKVLLKCHKNK
jgi:hypothetical protein